jgi:predicted AlkP superfamily phosphohydrolase/phosphomutase
MSIDVKNTRCIVIGIDGATFKIIQPLVEKGSLPNIAGLMSKGVQGNLLSGTPRISPSIWTTIITGKNPGKHGIYDFVQNDYSNKGYSFNSSADRKTKPIWSILSDHGKKVCISGLLMTYPPDKVNGYMVSEIISDLTGHAAKSAKNSHTYPAELAEEIESEIGSFILKRKKNNIMAMVHDIHESAKYRCKLYKYLSQKNKLDFQFFYFPETDTISHMGWRFLNGENGDLGNIIFDVYEKIDTYVGKLVADDNMNVILISDHGFSELKRVVSLNNLLVSMGMLKFKKNGIKAKYKRVARKFYLLKNLILNKREPLQGMNLKGFFDNVDWELTKAYHFGTSCGTIFINLKNRESRGIVEPAEYDALCAEVSMKLENVIDKKSGQKIIKKVHRREEIFSGAYMKDGPDLYMEFNDGFGVHMKKDARFSGTYGITDAKAWTGDHDENGIFIASGPQFKKGSTIENASVMDITPTILYIMGVPISNDIDGKILMDAIDEDFAEKNLPSYIDSNDDETGNDSDIYTEEDNDQIAQRLKDLGYLE